MLRLLAQGRTSREIAAALVITEKTAGHHVEHIYAKTGVTTRVGAALFAMRHDLASRPQDGEFSRCAAPRRGRTRRGMPIAHAVNGVRLVLRGARQRRPDPLHPRQPAARRWPGATRSSELARLGRVIAYDRRGCARSERPEPYERTSVAEHADDAAALLDALEAAPAVVIGRSYGGTVATDLALRYPDRVRALVAARGRCAARARAGGGRLGGRAGRAPARGGGAGRRRRGRRGADQRGAGEGAWRSLPGRAAADPDRQRPGDPRRAAGRVVAAGRRRRARHHRAAGAAGGGSRLAARAPGADRGAGARAAQRPHRAGRAAAT